MSDNEGMTVRTKYKIGDRACYGSGVYGIVCGRIEEIKIEVRDGFLEIRYRLHTRRVITRGWVDEYYLYPTRDALIAARGGVK